ncbi:MAG: MFS transporter, partial [Burkholderiaceae bacterium]|nr:MFS transporter [Burkholderiaceae bacterium]
RIGLFLASVYVLASLTQLVVGHLLDRIELKRLYQSIVLLQFLALLIASVTDGWWFLFLQFLFMAAIFGSVPFTDAMIVRYVDDAMRSRVAGMRLAIAFGASSVAVWLIGPIVKAAGFTTLLWVMAGMACITFAVISLLPVPHKPKEADSTR